MICTPHKNIKINSIVMLTMLILLVVAFTAVRIFSLPPVIWHSVFFVLAIIFCELLTKYFLPFYTYSFDGLNFIITKTLGNKVVTVCNIDSNRIVALYKKEEYKKQEWYTPKSIYNYNGNIVSDSCRVLIFKYNDCTEAVVFEPSSEMADAILSLTENQ